MRNREKRWAWIAGLAGCAVVAIQPARAATITYESYTVDDNTTVTINDTTLGVNDEVGGSGLINFYSGPNGTGRLIAKLFCVDIAHVLASSGTLTIIPAVQNGSLSNVTIDGTPGDGSYIDWATLGQIGELIDLGYADPGNSSQVQIAIWELENNSDPNFSISPTADIAALLDQAAGLGLGPDHHVDWLVDCNSDSGCNQGQAGIPGANFQTPEPATAYEFAGALGLLGFFAANRRRHRIRVRL